MLHLLTVLLVSYGTMKVKYQTCSNSENSNLLFFISCVVFVVDFIVVVAVAVVVYRLSSLLSVSFAINSLSHSHLSGGPVDLSYQMQHMVKIMVCVEP